MTAGQGAEGAEGRLLADVIAAEQRYSQAGWEAASRRLERAHAAAAAARSLWEQASEEVEAASVAIDDQEAATGVPGWQHLLIAPRREQCRIEYCRAHASGPGEAPF